MLVVAGKITEIVGTAAWVVQAVMAHEICADIEDIAKEESQQHVLDAYLDEGEV